MTVLAARPAKPQDVNRPDASPASGYLSPLMTVEQVATLLGVPISWVYERTRRRSFDRIPGFRLGKYWRFREEDMRQWIAGRRDF